MSKPLGFGLGLRAAHYGYVKEHRPKIDWFEVVTENFLDTGGTPRRNLHTFREMYPLVAHGVGLSIASTDPLRERYLSSLAALVNELDPTYVTDHLCWTRHHGQNSHDLLPVAYTRATLMHVKERVQQVQDRLKRRIFLENPTTYVQLRGNEMGEATFLRELCDLSGCGVLLDVNNLYVNQMNLGLDPVAYLDELRGEDLCYFHLAGHTVLEDIRIDTHDEHVPDAVWDLYATAARRFPHVATLVEWDDKLPEFPQLEQELDKARVMHACVTSDGPKRQGATSLGYAPRVPSSQANGGTTRAWAAAQDSFWSTMTCGSSVTADDERLAALVEGALPTRSDRGMNAYVDAYYLRLADVILDVHRTLANVLGRRVLHDIVKGFIAAQPPTESNIKYAARGLDAYLSSCPLPEELESIRGALRDVAALEWAYNDVFSELDGSSPVGIGAFAEIPPDAWEHVRISFIPAMHLIATEWDVQPAIEAVEAAQEPDKPLEGHRTYLVSRRHLAAHIEALPADAAAMLTTLRTGKPFLEAAEAARLAIGAAELDGTLVNKLVGHLAAWVNAGLICGIEA